MNSVVIKSYVRATTYLNFKAKARIGNDAYIGGEILLDLSHNVI